ncbi:MAG: DNA-processing protein DprA [Candidatus Limnocylindria bacterium]
MLGVGLDGPLGADGVPADTVGRPPGHRSVDGGERDAWAVLATVDGLGPAAFAVLLARFGSARAVLDTARRPSGVRELAESGAVDRVGTEGRSHHRIGEAVAREIVVVAGSAEAIAERIRRTGAAVITLDDPGYPARLRRIHLPPAVLFVHGDVTALDRRRACAVVGTRHPSGYGRMTAARISHALVAASATVVSGLALGIDGASHEATLRQGGVTVAVLGSGIGVIAPATHRRLADAIVARGGAIVSELGPDVRPGRGTFPRRNRLISGLADATVVVEAPAKSGSLLTAAWALEQGRPCFVVPGPIDAPTAAGCLSLLHELPGEVRIVSGVPQLIADLGFVDDSAAIRSAPVAAAVQSLGTTEARVAAELLAGRVTVDELVAVTGMTVATVLATLTLLERQGLVAGTYGRYRPAGALLAPAGPPRPR